MLKWMKLQNLALVEEAEVEFGPGFNAITGETGAGKSVIMGAVGLLLGERASLSAIRNGCDRCEISAEFQVPDYAAAGVASMLEEEAIESGSELLLRRVITRSGSRNFINGTPVTLNTLQKLGKLLIDIHAANSSQSLLQSAEQLAVLDRFGRNQKLQEEVRNAWNALAELRKKQEEFLSSMPSSDETERLRRDAAEIRRADPQENEDEILKAKHELAANARDIMEEAYKAEQYLSGDEGSVFSSLADIRRILMNLEKSDPVHGAEFIRRLEEISEAVSCLSGDLASHASAVELDEAEFQNMEERMRILQTMKRRYGPAIADVLAYLERTEEKIAAFDNAAAIRQDFERQEKTLQNAWQKAASALSARRKDVSKKLIAELSAETGKLGFAQAAFDIEFSTVQPGPGGEDQIRIMFSANPGSPLCPLKDVASSGEISRVMLAAKTVLAEADAIPILIFDEIDANIGGETAWTVGTELSKLAKKKQVICISHLAQVARAADSHFLVSKSTEEGVAKTRIRSLDSKTRISELARMLGGGTAAMEHAKEIVKRKD